MRIQPLIGDEFFSKDDAIQKLEQDIVSKYATELNARLEHALRHLVTPPIEGVITQVEIEKRELRIEHTVPEIVHGKYGVKIIWETHLWQGDKKIF
ncbi:MAG: hypothetical protein MJZ12_00060 [Prevotella sp.]|nr:hypothetical protein [Prevotella sp.]